MVNYSDEAMQVIFQKGRKKKDKQIRVPFRGHAQLNLGLYGQQDCTQGDVYIGLHQENKNLHCLKRVCFKFQDTAVS
jgi:hypothetical protein